MPRMSFSSTNKVNQRDDFPKLKLEQDEKARIWCPEEPVAEWVHNLKMPKIDPMTGKQALKPGQDKDGNDKQVPEFDFVSRPLCLGDVTTLEENQGLDPKRCPACREAAKSDMVDRPVRRFAMHVIRYGMNNSGQPQKPLQAAAHVWGFTDFNFGKLVDIAMEYGDLSELDLVLTCKNKLFQQYDLMASPKTWRQDDKMRDLTDEVYKENQAKDLSAFCGMTKKKDMIELDIDKIKERWDAVRGRSNASNALAAAETSTLTEGLDGLLDTPAATTVVKEEKKSNEGEAVDFDALFN